VQLAAYRSSSHTAKAQPNEQLRWHSWLVSMRGLMPDDITSIEYVRRQDFHANLLIANQRAAFQWSTVDRRWQGTIHLRDKSAERYEWFRVFCASFMLDGSPDVFDGLDDSHIESLVVINKRVSTPTPHKAARCGYAASP
jgi:hypothetical protein